MILHNGWYLSLNITKITKNGVPTRIGSQPVIDINNNQVNPLEYIVVQFKIHDLKAKKKKFIYDTMGVIKPESYLGDRSVYILTFRDPYRFKVILAHTHTKFQLVRLDKFFLKRLDISLPF